MKNLTIYNVYVEMQDQAQCDRMKQLCIDNGLNYWDDYTDAFKYVDSNDVFGFDIESKDFFILPYSLEDYTKVTEQEFIELLKNK